MQTISMIGLGYIGLPTATLLATRKKKVIGVDINPEVVDNINQGRIHIAEPELDMLVSAAVTAGYLLASSTVEAADCFLIAVPTPFKEKDLPKQISAGMVSTESRDPKPDLSYIQSAAQSIAQVLRKGNLVILESTVPVGTTEKLADWLAELRPDLSFPQQAGEQADVQIAHCPERVMPGRIVRELVSNDRIIGGMSQTASDMAVELYKTFVEGECIVTSVRTAEMCKLAENSYRDVNIAFANELSMICAEQGIDTAELIGLANRHPRVNILQPGCGVGGHCIAVDPWFIVHSAPGLAQLIRTAREVNNSKPDWVIEQVKQAVAQLEQQGRRAEQITIACLGITFKPNVNDLRQSPALAIAQELAQWSPGKLLVVEPNLESIPLELVDAGTTQVNLSESLAQAQVFILLVDHKEFADINSRLCEGQLLINTCSTRQKTSSEP